MNNFCIHIDGIDKSGKDSVKREIVKLSGGSVLIYNRSYISQIAYSIIYKRINYADYFVKRAIQDYNLGDKFFYLDVSRKEIIKRIIDTNEKDITKDDITYHKKVFKNVIDLFKNNKIKVYKIDTTNKTINECAKEIIKILQNEK